MYKVIENITELGFEPQMINVGGMADSFWLIPITGIAQMPNPQGVFAAFGVLQFKDYPPACTIVNVVPNTLMVTEEMQPSPNGNFWAVSIAFDLPKDEVLKARFVDEQNNNEFVVICRDGNGKTKVFGNKQTPMKLTTLLKEPGDYAGANKYGWALTCESKKPAPFLRYDIEDLRFLQYGNQIWLSKPRRPYTDEYELSYGDNPVIIN